MEFELQKVTKKYESKVAVDNLTLKLNPGVYGLLGANGAGKSTLMKMICSVLKPTSGKILFNGTDIHQLGEQYRNILGYLPQNFGYYSTFTAKDFLLYIAAVKGIPKKQAVQRMHELLELTSLSDVANKKIGQFSGGMKQRLGIAQAMLNNPNLIVLDEPTAGLDPKERVRFRNLISDFSKNNIVILSTHITSDVEYIADKIFLIKNGKIDIDGTVEELNNSMNGKVWKCILPYNNIEVMQKKYCVVNIKNESNLVELRVVSDTMPCSEAETVSATLEDLYLYHSAKM